MTQASDVLSQGVLFKSLLSAVVNPRLPFDAAGRTGVDGRPVRLSEWLRRHSATEVTYRVVHEAPADLRTLVPGIPPGVEPAVRRALAKAPANRFASAQDMSAAVRDSATPAMAPPDDTVVAPATRTIISPLEIERAERALAVHLGPIAKVLVRRTLANATTPAALWENLAVHIEHEADRAAFLRQLRRQR